MALPLCLRRGPGWSTAAVPGTEGTLMALRAQSSGPWARFLSSPHLGLPSVQWALIGCGREKVHRPTRGLEVRRWERAEAADPGSSGTGCWRAPCAVVAVAS